MQPAPSVPSSGSPVPNIGPSSTSDPASATRAAIVSALLPGIEAVRNFWLPVTADDGDDTDLTSLSSQSQSQSTQAVHPKPPRTVPRVHVSSLTEADFLRDYVAANKPVVLLGAVDHWPALRLWKGYEGLQRLAAAASVSSNGKQPQVTCTFTPNGRADAVTQVRLKTKAGEAVNEHLFVKPHEITAPFTDVLNRLRSGANPHSSSSTSPPLSTSLPCGFAYLSVQNDNLRRELPSLLADLAPSSASRGSTPAKVKIASAALGSAPDAVNIWIGGSGNVSSTHKDHYENLYSVIVGVKRFILMPPCDVLWLYERAFRAARFTHDATKCKVPVAKGKECSAAEKRSDGEFPDCWSVIEDSAQGKEEEPVPWIAVDPSMSVEQAEALGFPLFKHASPLIVDVRAGETLYLPALWYHHVSHPYDVSAACVTSNNDSNGGTGLTIAVNSWHDMNYLGLAWAHYNLLASLASLTTRKIRP